MLWKKYIYRGSLRTEVLWVLRILNLEQKKECSSNGEHPISKLCHVRQWINLINKSLSDLIHKTGSYTPRQI